MDDAQIAIAAEMADEQWELLAPVTQQSELIAQDLGDVDADNYTAVNPLIQGRPASYDLGPDLGLAGTTEGTTHQYDMPNDELYTLMQ